MIKLFIYFIYMVSIYLNICSLFFHSTQPSYSHSAFSILDHRNRKIFSSFDCNAMVFFSFFFEKEERMKLCAYFCLDFDPKLEMSRQWAIPNWSCTNYPSALDVCIYIYVCILCINIMSSLQMYSLFIL